MTPARKRIAMLIVLVGSGLIVERVVALSTDEAEISAPVRNKPARAEAAERGEPSEATVPAAVRLDRLDARQQAAEPSSKAASQPELFASVSWLPPPPKPVALPPPPKPVAPPFPYPYFGALSEDGVRTAFFTKGERVLPVKAGDTIDGAYRVDQMTDKQMMLTYLPLNETLVVALGSGR